MMASGNMACSFCQKLRPDQEVEDVLTRHDKSKCYQACEDCLDKDIALYDTKNGSWTLTAKGALVLLDNMGEQMQSLASESRRLSDYWSGRKLL